MRTHLGTERTSQKGTVARNQRQCGPNASVLWLDTQLQQGKAQMQRTLAWHLATARKGPTAVYLAWQSRPRVPAADAPCSPQSLLSPRHGPAPCQTARPAHLDQFVRTRVRIIRGLAVVYYIHQRQGHQAEEVLRSVLGKLQSGGP